MFVFDAKLHKKILFTNFFAIFVPKIYYFNTLPSMISTREKAIKGIIRWLLTSMSIAITCCFIFCSGHERSERQLRENAYTFANNYFNWHLAKALPYCTPESKKWIAYVASNVRQEDIELLRSKGEDARIEINDVIYADNDSMARVSISASNFLQMDSIEAKARIIGQANFEILMVLREGKWMVRMEGLPQSEN